MSLVGYLCVISGLLMCLSFERISWKKETFGVLKMAYPCQISLIKGFLTNRLALFMLAATCLHPDSTKGNSVVVLEQPSGEFQSPGYPDLDDDMRCTWKIIAPPYHRITITFLDFELLERSICIDEVEIVYSDVKNDTYRGTQLHQQSITSISNTVQVVLISCSTSLLSDRRGIRVSYSTVYPTTLKHETSKRATTTRQTTTKSITTTVNGPFLSQRNNMLSNVVDSTPTSLTLTQLHTQLPSLNNNSEQGLLYPLAGALLCALIVTIIIVMLIFKRKKANSPSRNTTNCSGNVEVNQAGYCTTVVPERNSVKNLDHDYSEVNEKQNDMNSVYYSRSIVSSSLDSSMIQKKHSQLDASNNLCVYENDTSSNQSRTGHDQDYSHTIYRIHQPSPFATK